MIYGPKLEPDHFYNDYINFKGDDEEYENQYIYCIFDEEYGLKACTRCGRCEEKTFACSEDEYDENGG